MANEKKIQPASERYALALYDLSVERGALDAVRADIAEVRSWFEESEDLGLALESAAVPGDKKDAVLSALAQSAGLSELTRNFLGVLGAHQRQALLRDATLAFKALDDAHHGVIAAEVVSAAPLTKTQLTRLSAALTTALGQSAELSARVDPALIGGLRVQVGSRLYDGSIKTKLDSLKFALKRA